MNIKLNSHFWLFSGLNGQFTQRWLNLLIWINLHLTCRKLSHILLSQMHSYNFIWYKTSWNKCRCFQSTSVTMFPHPENNTYKNWLILPHTPLHGFHWMSQITLTKIISLLISCLLCGGVYILGTYKHPNEPDKTFQGKKIADNKCAWTRLQCSSFKET